MCNLSMVKTQRHTHIFKTITDYEIQIDYHMLALIYIKHYALLSGELIIGNRITHTHIIQRKQNNKFLIYFLKQNTVTRKAL